MQGGFRVLMRQEVAEGVDGLPAMADRGLVFV